MAAMPFPHNVIILPFPAMISLLVNIATSHGRSFILLGSNNYRHVINRQSLVTIIQPWWLGLLERRVIILAPGRRWIESRLG